MNALPNRTDTVIVPPVKDTSTTGGGGTNHKSITKVIGITDCGAFFKKDADGNFTISSISFSNLSTGSEVELKAGNETKMFYSSKGGTLTTEVLYDFPFIVSSNPLEKDPTNVTDEDTLKAVGRWEITGLNAKTSNKYDRLIMIPVKTPSATSGKININDGMTSSQSKTLNSYALNKTLGIPAAPLDATLVKLKNIP